MKYISDLHIHPSFKPFNNLEQNPNVNIWDPFIAVEEHFTKLPRAIQNAIASTERSSQSNLNRLIGGNVRSVFFVIHPIEMGWFNRDFPTSHPIRKLIRKLKLKPEDEEYLGAAISGIHIERVRKLIAAFPNNEAKDYYDESFREYKFLVDSSNNTTGTNGAQLKFVEYYTEYKNEIKKKDTIVGIFTIEGGHALSILPQIKLTNKRYDQLTASEKNTIKNKYYLNIKKIKGLNTTNGFAKKHTPFWITLAHMYNNFLVGHAKTYKEGIGLIPGMEDLLDQKVGLDGPMTALGRKVLERLLIKTSDQKRILIDVKHMSLKSRLQYYDIVKTKRDLGDSIPIIFSHGGVTGKSKDIFQNFDSNSSDAGAYLSKWSINLFDEDIEAIYKSDGLIGIATHEGRIPGEQANNHLKDIKRAIGWGGHLADARRNWLRAEYIKLFLTGVFHIVSVINKKDAWKMICLGSDYDGIMDPFDEYRTSSDFEQFYKDVQFFLDDESSTALKLIQYRGGLRSEMPRAEMKRLMFGFSSKTIVEKIAYKNTDLFLSKYFTKNYLMT